jgi:hypothetical protein
LIRRAGALGLGDSIVNLQNGILSAVTAVSVYILSLHDREGFHDVVRIVRVDAVKVKEGSIQFGTELNAT